MKSMYKLAAGTLAIFFVASHGHSQDIDERLAIADMAKGETLFRQCKTCHTIDQGGPNRTGPNLYGVVGREVASVDGFRYSAAMRDHVGEWTAENLDVFLEDPRGTVTRTRMAFAGIREAQDRANLISYLNSFSDNPLELSNMADSSTAAAPIDEEPMEDDFGKLVVAPGAEEVFYGCTGCHSEMIVVQQGKTREGWDKLLDWMMEEQGMPEFELDERNVILDYLAEHYNTDRPNFPKP